MMLSTMSQSWEEDWCPRLVISTTLLVVGGLLNLLLPSVVQDVIAHPALMMVCGVLALVMYLIVIGSCMHVGYSIETSCQGRGLRPADDTRPSHGWVGLGWVCCLIICLIICPLLLASGIVTWLCRWWF